MKGISKKWVALALTMSMAAATLTGCQSTETGKDTAAATKEATESTEKQTAESTEASGQWLSDYLWFQTV